MCNLIVIAVTNKFNGKPIVINILVSSTHYCIILEDETNCFSNIFAI